MFNTYLQITTTNTSSFTVTEHNKAVTELILGHRGLGEESNYNYSKLKRKGKERESNASYFTINTSVFASSLTDTLSP
jgi:hypothetical protein